MGLPKENTGFCFLIFKARNENLTFKTIQDLKVLLDGVDNTLESHMPYALRCQVGAYINISRDFDDNFFSFFLL